MASELNSFAFNDFFIRFAEGVTNIGLPGLPKDVHLSISHHPNSQDINFHVTRNIGREEHKPKLVIFKINKVEAITALQTGCSQLWNLIFERISPAEMRYAEFIPFDKLKWMQRDAAEVIDQTTIRKKKKIRFNNQAINDCEDLMHRPSAQWRLRQSSQSFPRNYSGGPQAGLLISSNQCYCVLLTSAGCFRQKSTVSAELFTSAFLEQKMISSIRFKTLLAIQRVSVAENRHDIARYNQPLTLSSNSSFSSSGS
ncbi:hypothetical protein [Mucilaginibacter glaciei]|uniref:Uncharacterized protein n=1 Tax=Mucilaginibacter glaciei TaxID=2772109 RepID=A0A926S3P2_9SPHI|nr:hypothetical protein [Mucilaginibacter glaciei]MBD1395127.1 hypothetical protein [Mucilaginibacter glaciei]